MKHKPGDKIKIYVKKCCGGLVHQGDAELIQEVKPDPELPLWEVRFDGDNHTCNRYLYPEHEIKAAIAVTV